jgi:parallel beta-helix repeat protein
VRVMPRARRLAPSLCLLLACAAPGDDTTEADTTAAATAASTTTGTPTTTGTITTDDATTGPPAVPGCDVVVRADDGPAALAGALAGAVADSTICLSGQFTPGDTLTLSGASGVTIRGIDPGDGPGVGAVLDFQRTAGAPGLAVDGAAGLTLDNISFLNALGDGVRITAATDLHLDRIKVAWDGPTAGGELFAIYVSGAAGVLIERSEASGGRDAGIFVQGSTDVLVRGNRATANVSGVELENCTRGQIEDNDVEANVIGLFVLDLPGSGFGNGGDILVTNNRSRANNAVNFAEEGSVVASIPTGIGALVLASDRVELAGNELADNDTTGALVVSFEVVALLSGATHDDPTYDPWPQTVEIHDNTFTNNGQMPAEVFQTVFGQPTLPAITWDGAVDESKDDPQLNLCIRANGDADFLDLDALNLGEDKSTDLAPHDCDHPDVPPVAAG